MVTSTYKPKPGGGGRQLFQNCNVPLLVVVNTLLLLYIAMSVGPITSHGGSMMLAATDARSGQPGCDEGMRILRNQVASLMKLRVDYGQMYCEKHGIGPTGGYCVKTAEEEVGYNHYKDLKACARMAELFAGSSVLDLGCGLGHYGKCLQAAGKGIQWTGYDGSEGIEKATSGYVKFMDLAMPQYLERQYDWVMSLEVGEHIPAEFEDAFLSNLVRHAKKGVLLSWAVEGQGGHHHVNNHNNDYVIERLREKGFEYDVAASQSVRAAAELDWFKNTIMIFNRKK